MRFQNVLLTGGSGFLGKHLCEALPDRGFRAPRSAELDLLDPVAVSDYLSDEKVDCIIHAAGFVGGIGLNKAFPGRMILDNLRMGLNVLDAASARGGVHVLVVSTVCVYPSDAPIPTPESAMYDGAPASDTMPYGIAKRTLFTAAEALAKERGLTFSYVIPTNLYGPHDHFEEAKSHVVPALIKRMIEAKEAGLEEMVVWGDGSQTRDFLYVEDGARGVLAALEPAAYGRAINLSSGVETSIKDLVTTLAKVLGYEGRLVWDVSKPAGAPRRGLDGSLAKELVGFTPRVALEEGLRLTCDWYQSQRD